MELTSLVIKERLDSVNKLSFMIGMQVPEKYKENFDVSSEGATSGVWLATPDQGPSLETSKWTNPQLTKIMNSTSLDKNFITA